ncbi:MAG TPA: hypothetical protein VGG69_08935, partial [Rhizomicrobium sp.]
MKGLTGICVGIALCVLASAAFAATEDCSTAKGDVVLSARTPEVDLYDAPTGKKVMTVEQGKFP